MECAEGKPYYSESFVQIERDGEVVGAIPVGEGGKESYHCGIVDGEHAYKVYFSGTLKVKPSESGEILVRSASVDGIVDRCSDIELILAKGSLTNTSGRAGYLEIHRVGGQLVKRVKLHTGTLTVNLPQGIYIAASQRINVL